jgi:hypothetical protein
MYFVINPKQIDTVDSLFETVGNSLNIFDSEAIKLAISVDVNFKDA